MAVNNERLDARQRVRLANVISGERMELIALAYLGFEEEDIKSLIDQHKGKVSTINREILQIWCNKNSRDTQTKVSKVFLEHIGIVAKVQNSSKF